MKHKKILLTAISACTLAGTVLPICASCSCAKEEKKSDTKIIPTDYLDIRGNTLFGLVSGKDISAYDTLYIPGNVNEVAANAFKDVFTTSSTISTIKFASGVRKVKANAFVGCNKITKLDFSEFTEEDILYFEIEGDLLSSYEDSWFGSVTLPNLSDELITILKYKLKEANIPLNWYVPSTEGHVEMKEETKQQEYDELNGDVSFGFDLKDDIVKTHTLYAQANIVEKSEGVDLEIDQPVIDSIRKKAYCNARLVNATKTGQYVKYKLTITCAEKATLEQTNTNASAITYNDVLWTQTIEVLVITNKATEYVPATGIYVAEDSAVGIYPTDSYTVNAYVTPLDATDKTYTVTVPQEYQEYVTATQNEDGTWDVEVAKSAIGKIEGSTVTLTITANDPKAATTLTTTLDLYIQNVDDIDYTLDENNKATVFAGKQIEFRTEAEPLTIPSRVQAKDGSSTYYDVVAIKDEGFKKVADKISELQFYPNGYLKKIGKSAFEGFKVTQFDLSGAYGLEEIGDKAFANCEQLQYVYFGYSNALQTIGAEAFAGCSSLVSSSQSDDVFYLPKSVLKIGKDAFKDCDSLTKVCFDLCYSGTEFYNYHFGWKNTSDDTVRWAPTDDYEQNATDLKSTTYEQDWILDTRYVYYKKFTQSSSASSQEDSICVSAFDNDSFTGKTVTIPDKIKVGNNSYTVRAISYKNYFSNTPFNDGVYFGWGNDTETVDLRNNHIETIGYDAFWYTNASNLEDNLKTIIFPTATNIKSIGDYAFWYRTKLQSIGSLTECNEIGENPFIGCESLTSISFDTSKFVLDNRCVYGINNSKKERLISWLDVWKEDSTSFTINDEVKTIDEDVFDGSYLQSITIPSNVTQLGDYCFDYCYSLKTVTFAAGSKLEAIPYCCFEYCPELTSITIPASVKTIGDYAFYCDDEYGFDSKLSSLNFESPDTSALEYIGYEAFYGHRINSTSGTSIVFPKNLKTIDEEAFSTYQFDDGAPSSTYAQISFASGSKLQTVGDWAFYKMPLYKLELPENVVKVGQEAFAQCALTELTLNPHTDYNYDSFGEPDNYDEEIDPSLYNDLYYYDDLNAAEDSLSQEPEYYAAYLKAKPTSGGSQNEKFGLVGWYGQDVHITPAAGCLSIASYMEYAWCGNTQFTSETITVTLPSTLKRICSNAFDNCYTYYRDIQPKSNPAYGVQTTIDFANLSSTALESIGSYSFGLATSEQTLTFPSTLKEIDSHAFVYYDNYQKELRVGENSNGGGGEVYRRNNLALDFKNCASLTYVGPYAFAGIIITNNELYLPYVKDIAENCSLGGLILDLNTTALTLDTSEYTVDETNNAVLSKDGKQYIKSLYNNNYGTLDPEEYTIPSTVETICTGAFYYFAAYRKVTIPSSVKTIEPYAFEYACADDNTEGAYIGIETVDFEENSQISSIGDYAFLCAHTLESINLPQTTTHGDLFGWFVFCDSALTQVYVPSGVTAINGAFAGCVQLDRLHLPKSLQTLYMADFGCRYYWGGSTPTTPTILYEGTDKEYSDILKLVYPTNTTDSGIEEDAEYYARLALRLESYINIRCNEGQGPLVKFTIMNDESIKYYIKSYSNFL